MAITGTLFAAAYTTFERALPRWRLKRAAHEIETAVRATRTKAILEREVVSMPIDLQGGRYEVIDRSAAGMTELVHDEEGEPRRVARLPKGILFSEPGTPPTVSEPPQADGDLEIGFTPRGKLVSEEVPLFVYLGAPGHGMYARVGIDLAGNTRIQRYHEGVWR